MRNSTEDCGRIGSQLRLERSVLLLGRNVRTIQFPKFTAFSDSVVRTIAQFWIG